MYLCIKKGWRCWRIGCNHRVSLAMKSHPQNISFLCKIPVVQSTHELCQDSLPGMVRGFPVRCLEVLWGMIRLHSWSVAKKSLWLVTNFCIGVWMVLCTQVPWIQHAHPKNTVGGFLGFFSHFYPSAHLATYARCLVPKIFRKMFLCIPLPRPWKVNSRGVLLVDRSTQKNIKQNFCFTLFWWNSLSPKG